VGVDRGRKLGSGSAEESKDRPPRKQGPKRTFFAKKSEQGHGAKIYLEDKEPHDILRDRTPVENLAEVGHKSIKKPPACNGKTKKGFTEMT